MRIHVGPGNKGPGDHIIRVSANDEAVRHFEVAFLVNQLALNELRIKGEAIKRTGRFFFEEMIQSAIDNAREGVNWRDSPDEIETAFHTTWMIPNKKILVVEK